MCKIFNLFKIHLIIAVLSWRGDVEILSPSQPVINAPQSTSISACQSAKREIVQGFNFFIVIGSVILPFLSWA
jgi:hypothetical protein